MIMTISGKGTSDRGYRKVVQVSKTDTCQTSLGSLSVGEISKLVHSKIPRTPWSVHNRVKTNHDTFQMILSTFERRILSKDSLANFVKVPREKSLSKRSAECYFYLGATRRIIYVIPLGYNKRLYLRIILQTYVPSIRPNNVSYIA